MKYEQVKESLGVVDGYKGRSIDTEKDLWTVKDDALQYRHGGRKWQPSRKVVQEATALCGIPQAYANKCELDFLAMQLNHWMPSLGQVQMVTKDDNLVALTRPTSPILSPTMILDKIENTLHPNDYFRATIKEDKVCIYVVGQVEEAVRKGDVVRGGAYIEFSPTGVTSPLVKGFIERLICTNGAVSNEDTLIFSFGGDEGGSFNKWLRNSLVSATKSVKKTAVTLREMANTKINPSEVLDHVLRASLPDMVKDSIRAKVMDQGAPTMYDLYNHITYVASHEVEDEQIVHRLMTNASEVGKHKSCPVCHRRR